MGNYPKFSQNVTNRYVLLIVKKLIALFFVELLKKDFGRAKSPSRVQKNENKKT